jgi:hypothetical protein
MINYKHTQKHIQNHKNTLTEPIHKDQSFTIFENNEITIKLCNGNNKLESIIINDIETLPNNYVISTKRYNNFIIINFINNINENMLNHCYLDSYYTSIQLYKTNDDDKLIQLIIRVYEENSEI